MTDTALAASTAAADAVASVPLIPRDALYGNPTRAAGRVSPDGKWLSWLAPHEGVMNVWIAPASDPTSVPPKSIRPVVGTKPVIPSMNVVLPAPFGPISPTS